MAGQGEWWDGLLPPGGGGDGSDPPDDESPIVEWDPIACPYCGSRKKRTYGRSRHKPVRFHRCLKCRRGFRSIERRKEND